MKKLLQYCLCALIVPLCLYSAQGQNADTSGAGKHSVVAAENAVWVNGYVGGFIGATAEYERGLNDFLAFRIGLGVGDVLRINIWGKGNPTQTGLLATGLLTAFFPVNCNHKFEFSAGGAYLSTYDNSFYPVVTAGYRYARPEGGFRFRVGLGFPVALVSIGYGF